jgi:ATP-dependent Lhr-like helicase
MFPQNLQKAASLVPAHMEMGLADLISHGMVTCDSYGALRQMIQPPSKRKTLIQPVGRWSLLRTENAGEASDEAVEMLAKQMLARTGVVFRKTVMREKLPVPWSSLSRVYRRMELRGQVRGGRFVGGFSGEQYALPEAVELLRLLRRNGPRETVSVVSADPLNFQGILTPEKRVAVTRRMEVKVG